MIEARKVNFEYSDVFSLKNINLKVEKGDDSGNYRPKWFWKNDFT